ncbi:MAG: CoA pyrophosphatase [Actinobacteria bacterium]|nr:CoA pyrophosphatase [Actinomycetota bacterium]
MSGAGDAHEPPPALDELLDCVAGALLTVEESLAMNALGRDAAVLIPFRPGPRGVDVVFTKRRDDLPHHAGQISFPGGRADEADTDLLATALRESQEELEIPPESVRVIGALEPISTFVSDFAVYPFVGLVDPDVPLVPHPGEVDTVFEVELRTLAAMRERREMRRGGMTFTTEAYETEGGLVWGVTGYILGRLLDRIEGCLTGGA